MVVDAHKQSTLTTAAPNNSHYILEQLKKLNSDYKPLISISPAAENTERQVRYYPDKWETVKHYLLTLYP